MESNCNKHFGSRMSKINNMSIFLFSKCRDIFSNLQILFNISKANMI